MNLNLNLRQLNLSAFSSPSQNKQITFFLSDVFAFVLLLLLLLFFFFFQYSRKPHLFT